MKDKIKSLFGGFSTPEPEQKDEIVQEAASFDYQAEVKDLKEKLEAAESYKKAYEELLVEYQEAEAMFEKFVIKTRMDRVVALVGTSKAEKLSNLVKKMDSDEFSDWLSVMEEQVKEEDVAFKEIGISAVVDADKVQKLELPKADEEVSNKHHKFKNILMKHFKETK